MFSPPGPAFDNPGLCWKHTQVISAFDPRADLVPLSSQGFSMTEPARQIREIVEDLLPLVVAMVAIGLKMWLYW